MNKAIIAIDSFKGCLTSEEAGSAVMEGIKTIFPDCETLLFPIADGGEGMLDILTSATKGKYRTLPAHGPLMELVQGRYGISGDGQTALIEMAAVSGLPLVPEDKRNPMLTTTYGTGAGKSVGDRRQDHVAGSLHRYICRTSGFKGGPLHDCLRCTQSLLRV